MSTKAFTVGATNPILDQPIHGPDPFDFVYARSSESEGSDVHIAVTGRDDAGDPSHETITLTNSIGNVEVKSNTEFSLISSVSLDVAEGDITLFAGGTAATGEFRIETNTADGTTLTFGLVGYTRAYRFKNTLAQAYDVKIGADATATVLNLKKAINADGVAGTNYFAGTNANTLVSASVSGTIITLTDRIACNRQLNWSFAQSSTHFSLPSTLSGGVDGVLIARLPYMVTSVPAFNKITLSSEDLVATTLPGYLTPTTDWIRLSGRQCILQFKCANVTSAIALRYETSTDKINASTGVTAITSLDNKTVAAPLIVTPSERCIEYLRLVFTSNADGNDYALDARAIFPP